MKHKQFFKSISLFLIASTVFLLTGCDGDGAPSTTTSGDTGLYPFKSAVVQYKVTGSSEGNQTLYIKNGMTATEKHTQTETAGYTQYENTFTVNTGDFIYEIDLDNSKGVKTKNELNETIKTLTPEQKIDLGKKLAAGLSADSQGSADEILTSLGTETIAGQKCEKYNPLGLGTVCIWNNIPLKTQISIADIDLIIEATSVNEGASVSDSKFMVPKGVEVTEI